MLRCRIVGMEVEMAARLALGNNVCDECVFLVGLVIGLESLYII